MLSRTYIQQARKSSNRDRYLQIQQPGGVAAEDGAALGAVEDVVGAVQVDQVLQLVVGVDERIEIEPLQVGRRHLLEMHAGVGAGRGGVVDPPRISRQIAAAMGDDDLQ